VCACVSESVSESMCVCVIVYVSEASLLQQCSGYGCRPYGRCQSPTQLGEGRGQIVCQSESVCVREGVREIQGLCMCQ